MNEIVSEKLKLLPDSPGVYRMKNTQGEIIYVGKAINLKNRVRQYFQSQKNMAPKVIAMVSHIADFEYILTANEAEALTLEASLIKSLQPRYNILLKDDKHFPYVRLDERQDFPRFEVVRKVKNDGARYFGPYLSALSVRDSLELIRNSFPVRHCKKDISKAIVRGERPCLMYHIGKCCAPCSGNVSRESYHELLDSVSDFLEGNTSTVTALLTKKMQEASENMEFERAAQLRDKIAAVKSLSEKQRAMSTKGVDYDIFALARDGDDSLVFALFMRGGTVVGTRDMRIDCADEPISEVMAAFIKQYYSDYTDIPRTILVHDMPDEAEALETWLKEMSGHAVSIAKPMRGDKLKQVDMAANNAIATIMKQRELTYREYERNEGALAKLAGLLDLDVVPTRMECFDNSHMQGRDTVSSMVVFLNGKKAPQEYRRFKIKAEADSDDYLAMREVLTRRFERAKNGDGKFTSLPDLLVVDGGRGQLNVAAEVLNEFGLSHIAAIGLAEENEEIYTLDSDAPIRLKRSDITLQLLQRIRDEAHRFAITYHRSLRAKTALFSELDTIEGVGAKRKRALFDTFTSIDAIANADVQTLSKTKGMTKSAAQAVYDHFHKNGEKND